MDKDQILHMRVGTATKAMLDDLRKREDDLPSRSEMVRRLIERAAWNKTTIKVAGATARVGTAPDD